MFANFSFTPSSTRHHRPQSQSQYEYPAVTYDAPSPTRTASLSPTSSRSTSPSRLPRYEYAPLRPTISPIHLSVTELSHKLSAHTLNLPPRPRHPHPQPRHHASSTPTPSPPCEHDDETFFELDHSPPRAADRGTRTEANCRRRQRQTHSRLQCDPRHLNALADLVEGMVKGGSQCFVYEAPGVVSGKQEEEDGEEEGEVEEEEEDEASMRARGRKQSVEWAKGRTCVSKSVRVRREGAGRGGRQVRRPER